MHNTEWSLVFFTTISQLAAGIMVAVLPFVFTKNQDRYAKISHTSSYYAAGLMLVALILSFLHLNNPVNAIYAVSNLKTSWLSREILFVSLFLFCLIFVNLISYFKNPGIRFYRMLILITSIIGVVMVYSMSMLYIIPTVPPWNNISTLIAFFATAFILGAVFVMNLSKIQDITTGNKNLVMLYITIVTIALIVINKFFIPQNVPEGNIAFNPQPIGPALMFTRWLTLLFGAISLVFILFKKDRFKKIQLIYFLPFVLFFISELIARAAFYTSFYNIGL